MEENANLHEHTSDEEDPWFTSADVCGYARVSMRTVERHTHDGTLRSCRINGNGHRRYRRSWVDLWIAGGGHLALALVALLTMLVAITVLQLACGDDCGLRHLLHHFNLDPDHPPRHG